MPLPGISGATSIATVLGAAAGTDGSTVSDSALTVLGAIGANSADNAMDTSLVVANKDGSVLERLEDIKDELSGTAGIVTFPSGAAAANAVSIAEVVRSTQEGVRKASGTALATGKSLVDALGSDGTTVTDSAVSVLGAIGADNNNNAFASTSIVSNADGSVLERLEYLQAQLTAAGARSQWQYATKTSTSALTSGSIFTWAGTIEFKIIGRVTTVIQSQATTVKLQITPDALAAADLCGTKDINAFAVGSLISITGTTANAAVSTTAVGHIGPWQDGSQLATCVTSGTITTVFGAASTGAIVWEILWRPLNAAGSVAAA
jgi:hypothetical protein